jgi:Tol biopolymer transport system component
MKLLTPLVASVLLALVACTSSSAGQTSTASAVRGTIAFGRVDASGNEYVFTIHADGTHEKALTPISACCPVWSHKGDRLILSGQLAGGSNSAITTATAKADGSHYLVLPLDSSGLNLGGNAWSPDDTRLAFEGWDDNNPSLNGLYTADAIGGGNRRRLTSTTAAEHDVPIGYSPDGSRILFWRGPGNIPDSAEGLGQLYVVGVDGGAVTQVTPPGMTAWHDMSFGAQGGWSPDGAHISFSAFSPGPSDPGRSAVFVAAGDGTNAKQISDWGDYTTSAHWSPTGDWIVFDKINAAAGGHSFYLVHPDGSGTRSIASLGPVCCAVWSPDGQRLLFSRASDLWTVMIDGSHPTQVTHTPAELTDISWTSASS